ncbi:DUF4845 domain-containing protein [Ectothiorhodospira sp. BSL-9]|uniref:DUF4845 domain-containing protein n=1 Tax=Ectothiorhodospira sp. BSL-9 TaxID=1442136 RepID=UPI0007B448D8|nr:DUF4845 domain-containing protein [Ectothiorhodospira sp. BSL-9]ANB03872.1 hypothetical protein ECTOBSL9_2415 [Ectothiorhodospira sp. BSL-9]
MKTLHSQSGAGFIPLLLIIGILVMLGTVGLRLFPVYMEYWNATSIVKDVASEPGAANKNARQLWTDVNRRFQINSVDNVQRDHVTVEQQGGGQVLRVQYEVRTPMIANVDAVVSFDRSYPLAD